MAEPQAATRVPSAPAEARRLVAHIAETVIRYKDVFAASIAFALVASLHVLIFNAPPYGDEPMHYYFAAHGFAPPARATDLLLGTLWHPTRILWQRPLYYGAMAPAAHVSFEAFRLLNLVAASAAAPLGFLLLRRHGAGLVTSFTTASVAALLAAPYAFGTYGLMDAPMASLVLAALLALDHERPVLAASLLVAAVWTKESAAFALLLIGLQRSLPRLAGSEIRVFPLRLDRETTAFLLAALLAPVPLVLALLHGLGAPGGPAGGDGRSLLEDLTVAPFVLGIAALGLRRRASRPLATLALAHVAALLMLHTVFHRAVELWYTVLPVLLLCLAAGLAVGAPSAAPRPARSWKAALRAGWLVLFCALVLAPQSSSLGLLEHPLTHRPHETLADRITFETRIRDQDFRRALTTLRASNATDTLLLDVDYPQALWVLHESPVHVWLVSSVLNDLVDTDPDLLLHRLLAPGTLTIVRHNDAFLASTIEVRFAACRTFAEGSFAAYNGSACPPEAAETFRADYDAHFSARLSGQ